MNINLQIDSESEALKALLRLASFSPKNIVKELSVNVAGKGEMDTMKSEALRSYTRTWGGVSRTQGRGAVQRFVYRAVKQALLGHTRRGDLTGSTLKSIKGWVEGDNTAFGGIEGGTWPLGGPDVSAPMWKVARELDLTWDIEKAFAPKIGTEVYRESMRKRKEELKRFSEGTPAGMMPVVMKMGSAGFQIVWPEVAKKILKLKDWPDTPKSEPFDTKQYYMDFQDKMISMTKDFINQTMGYVETQYENVLQGQRMAREEDTTPVREFDPGRLTAIDYSNFPSGPARAKARSEADRLGGPSQNLIEMEERMRMQEQMERTERIIMEKTGKTSAEYLREIGAEAAKNFLRKIIKGDYSDWKF